MREGCRIWGVAIGLRALPLPVGGGPGGARVSELFVVAHTCSPRTCKAEATPVSQGVRGQPPELRGGDPVYHPTPQKSD